MRQLNTFKSSVFNGFTPSCKPLNRGRKITNSYYPPSLVERYAESSYKSFMPAGNLLTFQFNSNKSNPNQPDLWINTPEGKVLGGYTDSCTSNYIITVIWDGTYVNVPVTCGGYIDQFNKQLEFVNFINFDAVVPAPTGVTMGENLNVVSTSNFSNQFVIFSKDFSNYNIVNMAGYGAAWALNYFNGYHYLLIDTKSGAALLAVNDQTGNIDYNIALPLSGAAYTEWAGAVMAYANNNIYLLANTNYPNPYFSFYIFDFPLSQPIASNTFQVGSCAGGCALNILTSKEYIYASFLFGNALYVFDAYNANIINTLQTSAETLAQIGSTTYTVFSDGVNTYIAELDLTTGNISQKKTIFNFVTYPDETIVIS